MATFPRTRRNDRARHYAGADEPIGTTLRCAVGVSQ